MKYLAYAEKTSNTDITATSEATANTIVAADPVEFDGGTVILVEFGTNAWAQTSTSPVNRLVLFEDDSPIGTLFQGVSPSTSSGKPGFTVRRRMTPTAGTHTYSVRGWVSSSSTMIVAGDTFGSGIDSPAYISVIKASEDATLMWMTTL